MNCDGVKERLVDFLYQDLPADARAAFEEHLRGCPACKADVASYRRTLGNARAALTGVLAEEPPVRVHAAVLEAAKAAAARKTTMVRARKETTSGFFARLWRTPWLMPAFGAASVATVVFLVRVLKNPEVLPGQRPLSNGELVEPGRAAPAPMAAPAQEPGWAAPAAAEEANAKAKAGPSDRGGKSEGGKLGMAKAQRPAHELRKGAVDGLARSASGAVSADKESAPEPTRAKKKVGGDLQWGGLSGETDGSHGMEKSRFAEPPPPRPAPARRDEASEMRRPRLEDTNVAGVAPAPTPLAAPSAVRKTEETAEQAPSAAARSLDEDARDAQAAKGRGQPSLPSFDDSLRRAERLFAEQNWNAAAEAYRDLLRRYPGHKDVGKWRARVDQSLVAERRRLPAAKAARTGDEAKAARE
jgi:hypothetical protein